MNDVITFFMLVVKNVLASSPFNLILLMVPQAQCKPMVDRIVTFKLSLATGVRDRMEQFDSMGVLGHFFI